MDELRVLDALFRDQLDLRCLEPRAENGGLVKMGVRAVLTTAVWKHSFRKKKAQTGKGKPAYSRDVAI